MIDIIAAIFVGGVLATVGFYMYGRIEYYKGQYEAEMDKSDELLERALEAEKSTQAMFDKYADQQNLIKQMMDRPVMVGLGEDHVKKIAHALVDLVEHQLNMYQPNKVN